MSHTVSLAPDVYTLLQERARQNHTSPDHLANEALRKYLGELEPAWPQEIDALIERVQKRTAAFAEDEIEADITTAAREAREARPARRRALIRMSGFRRLSIHTVFQLRQGSQVLYSLHALVVTPLGGRAHQNHLKALLRRST